ncbi:hypothetical protein AFCA_013288 [Aspergillus flavus]|nr:hypothetical protein AFCA_013288 [Aspergillus flavus]
MIHNHDKPCTDIVSDVPNVDDMLFFAIHMSGLTVERIFWNPSSPSVCPGWWECSAFSHRQMQLDGGESASRNGNPTKAAAFRVEFPPTRQPSILRGWRTSTWWAYGSPRSSSGDKKNAACCRSLTPRYSLQVTDLLTASK